MTDDIRLQTWLRRGIQLVLIGMATDVLGLIAYDRLTFASQLIIAFGVLLQVVGLVQLIAWVQLLGRQLRSQRSQ